MDILPSSNCHACEGCDAAADRRAFLRDAARAGLALLVALGASPGRASALGLHTLTARTVKRDQVSYPVPPADGVHIDHDNEVILVRYEGAAYAFALSCPHQNTALRWLENDGIFQCPKHKSKYQPNGTFISGRATRGLDRFAVRRQGDAVLVDIDRLYKQDDDAAAWAAAVVKL